MNKKYLLTSQGVMLKSLIKKLLKKTKNLMKKSKKFSKNYCRKKQKRLNVIKSSRKSSCLFLVAELHTAFDEATADVDRVLANATSAMSLKK